MQINVNTNVTIAWEYVIALLNFGCKKKFFSGDIYATLENGQPTGIHLTCGLDLSNQTPESLGAIYDLEQSVIKKLEPLLGNLPPDLEEIASKVDQLNLSEADLETIKDKYQEKLAAKTNAKLTQKLGASYPKMTGIQKTLCAIVTENTSLETTTNILTHAQNGDWDLALSEMSQAVMDHGNGDSLESKIAKELVNSVKKELQKKTEDKPQEKKTEEQKKAAPAAKKEEEEEDEEENSSGSTQTEETSEEIIEEDVKDVEEDIEYTGDNDKVEEIEEECPIKEKDEKSEKESEICEFSKLQVEKPSRGFVYTWAGAKTTEESSALYEIVAGHKKKASQVNLTLSGLNIDCTKHDRTHWDLEKGPYTGAKRAITCNSNPANGIADVIWPYRITPKSYRVKATTCSLSHEVIVRVYPDTKYTVKLTWELQLANLFKGKKSPKVSCTATSSSDSVTRTLKINDAGIAYEVQSGSDLETEVGNRITKTISALVELKKAATSVVDGFKEDNTSQPEPAFKFNTKLDLDFEWGWREKSGSPMCEYAFVGGLNTKPLIELGWKKDLLGSAVLAIPVVGNFILGTKKLLKYLDAGELSLILEITGNLGFSFATTTWILSELEESVTFVPATVSGAISVKLEGKMEASVKTSFFGIKAGASAGAVIGAEAGFKLGDKSGLFLGKADSKLTLTVDFTGLCVYAKAFFQTGISISAEGEIPLSAASRLDDSGSDPASLAVKGEAGTTYKKESDNKGFIIDPKEDFWSHTIKLS